MLLEYYETCIDLILKQPWEFMLIEYSGIGSNRHTNSMKKLAPGVTNTPLVLLQNAWDSLLEKSHVLGTFCLASVFN